MVKQRMPPKYFVVVNSSSSYLLLLIYMFLPLTLLFTAVDNHLKKRRCVPLLFTIYITVYYCLPPHSETFIYFKLKFYSPFSLLTYLPQLFEILVLEVLHSD